MSHSTAEIDTLAFLISRTAGQNTEHVRAGRQIESKFFDTIHTEPAWRVLLFPAAIQKVLSVNPPHASTFQEILGLILSKAIKRMVNTDHLPEALDATLLPYEDERYAYRAHNVRAAASRNFTRGIDYLIEVEQDPAAALALAQRALVAGEHNKFLLQGIAYKLPKLVIANPGQNEAFIQLCQGAVTGLDTLSSLTESGTIRKKLLHHKYQIMILEAQLSGKSLPPKPGSLAHMPQHAQLR